MSSPNFNATDAWLEEMNAYQIAHTFGFCLDCPGVLVTKPLRLPWCDQLLVDTCERCGKQPILDAWRAFRARPIGAIMPPQWHRACFAMWPR